jgi:hypothetical protein
LCFVVSQNGRAILKARSKSCQATLLVRVSVEFCGAVETTLGTHRFQREVVGKDVLIGIKCPRSLLACVE